MKTQETLDVQNQTYTNDPIKGTSTTTVGITELLGTSSTTNGYMWSAPTRLEVRELQDSIEMIYEETSLMTNTLAIYPPPPPEKRHFKIVFSCVDGKWNKSERIYGKKIEGFSYFEF